MDRGVVQICLNGAWGTICNRGIGYGAPQLMCTQLGFQTRGKNKKMHTVVAKPSIIRIQSTE